MNRGQKIIGYVVIVLVILSFLFPHWDRKFGPNAAYSYSGINWLFIEKGYPTFPKVDYPMTAIQIAVVLIAGSLLILILKSPKNPN